MVEKSLKPFKQRKGEVFFLLLFLWSGLLDSNQRPRAPQTCALPTALNPEQLYAFLEMRVQRYNVFLNPANF